MHHSFLFFFRRGFSVEESSESDSGLEDNDESLKSLLSSLLLSLETSPSLELSDSTELLELSKELVE